MPAMWTRQTLRASLGVDEEGRSLGWGHCGQAAGDTLQPACCVTYGKSLNLSEP